MILTGIAKGKFMIWFTKDKWLSGFEDKDPIIQLFLINEWFGTVGYKISIISRYIKDDFGYRISINTGNFSQFGFKTRTEADKEAILTSNDDFNERYS